MAVTELHRITTTLNKALEYIENPKKTDDKLLVSSFACSPQTAFHQFNQVKRNADKTGGTLAFHLIQSFAPGEVDYEKAREIGTQLADKVFQGILAESCDDCYRHFFVIVFKIKGDRIEKANRIFF